MKFGNWQIEVKFILPDRVWKPERSENSTWRSVDQLYKRSIAITQDIYYKNTMNLVITVLLSCYYVN